MGATIRSTSIVTVTIPNGGALSQAICMADYAMGSVIMPAAWTTASLAFKICDSQGGTFAPLRGSTGAIVEVTGMGGGGACPLPAEVLSCQYFKIWSESAGGDITQGGDRVFTVMLKS